MSEEIVFYSSPMSRGRMVHWMLEEVGAPYRFEVVNLERSDQKKPHYLAVNPMGKVPAIVHRGTVVTECGAIITYLADAFPAARLAPPPGQPGTRHLLPLDVLRRVLRRTGGDRSHAVASASLASGRARLRLLRGHRGSAGKSPDARTLYPGLRTSVPPMSTSARRSASG